MVLVQNVLAGIHQTFLVRAFICLYKRFHYTKELSDCLNIASYPALPASHLDTGVDTHLCISYISDIFVHHTIDICAIVIVCKLCTLVLVKP